MEIFEKSFEIFFVLFLVGVFLYIIKGYIVPLFLAGALVFLGTKPYRYIDSKIRNDSLSAIIMLILVLVLIFVPLFWLTSSVIVQLGGVIDDSSAIFDGDLDLSNCSFNVCRSFENEFNEINVDSLLTKIFDYVSTSFEKIFYSATEFLVNFFIFILAFYFLLKEGDSFKKYLRRIIPMKNSYKDALFLKFRDVSEAVFLNLFVIAFIQGFLTSVGLWIVGFDSFIFWGVVAAFLSLLPIFGPALIWFPSGIYLLMIGDVTWGIFLLVYGIILISISDNIARAYLLKKSTHVHEFLIFISILGGIKVFDFITGLFVGPMVISLLVALIDIYKINFR